MERNRRGVASRLLLRRRRNRPDPRCSNVAAVLLFALSGKVLWLLGLSMAVGAMAGGWLGSHTAMRYGAKLIRPLLVTASVAMTGRLLWGYFSGG